MKYIQQLREITLRRLLLHGISFLVFILCTHVVHAQQDPVYAGYLQNPMAINPAYAGSNKMLNASIQYRNQWTGVNANPVTINFSSHMSVYANKAGVGLMVIQDRLGDTRNTEVQGVFSYNIPVSTANLSFGMQTGFIRYQTDPSSLTILDPSDPTFNAITETKFNTGVGVLLKNDNYMIGLSVPRLLPATVSQGGQNIELYKQTYYLFGAYSWMVNENLRFKPSVLLRGTAGSPLSVDLNATFTFKELYTTGLFTRSFNTYGILTQIVAGKFRVGYVFELPGGSSRLNFATHEIMVGLALNALPFHDLALKTF